MTDADALLRAVLARPQGDTPRLVFADWCDDHAGTIDCPRCRGEGRVESPNPAFTRECDRCRGSGAVSNGYAERAEFIRVQCELAGRECPGACISFPHGSGGCRRCEWEALRHRERELFLAHGRAWFGDTALWLPTEDHTRASPHAPGLIVSRGFVSGWRGPLGAWVGEKCPHCTGGRFGYPPPETADCPACGGTGDRTPGVGPRLVAAHPVETVVAVGAEPFHYDNEQSHWYDAREMVGFEEVHPASNVPGDVYDVLTGGEVIGRFRYYHTRAEASEDLAAALLALARRRAVELGLAPPGLWG